MKKKERTRKNSNTLSAEELDRKFDRGENVIQHAKEGKAIFRVNVDFPAWTVSELDQESDRLGITRQSLIKVWIAERLDRIRKENPLESKDGAENKKAGKP